MQGMEHEGRGKAWSQDSSEAKPRKHDEEAAGSGLEAFASSCFVQQGLVSGRCDPESDWSS